MTLWQEIKKELRWVGPLVLVVLIFLFFSFWWDSFKIEKTQAFTFNRANSPSGQNKINPSKVQYVMDGRTAKAQKHIGL